jgi:hypothetical protein
MAIDEVTKPRKFPDYEASLREVVAEHARIEDEPLLYAAYVELERDREHVFLFEIADSFVGNGVDPDRELLEVGFRELASMPLASGQMVKLILTNPVEIKAAAEGDWYLMRELRSAFRRGRWIRLYGDPKWESLL